MCLWFPNYCCFCERCRQRSHGSFVPMYDISSVSRLSISDISLISNVQSNMSILFCLLIPVKQFDCAFFISKGIHVGCV